MKLKEYLNESSLSRIWSHIESNKPFGVVSASRSENTNKENEENHVALKKVVRELGYGFIEMRGGYKEDSGFVYEKSLFIPDITKKEIIELGEKYKQESIIFKDKNGFYLLDTRDNVGNEILKFTMKGGKKDLELSKDKIKDFFSELTKGSHKGRKFLFRIEERETSNFNRTVYMKKEPKWFIIMEKKSEV
ncbi:MAG: DUF3293 domain-containing protein [Elusimicrobiota bacterium]